jgi:hypothetical protein
MIPTAKAITVQMKIFNRGFLEDDQIVLDWVLFSSFIASKMLPFIDILI